MTFTVNSELLRGRSVVVFENFFQGDVRVYAHADIDDEAQRIDYPDVHTTALADPTQDHVGDTDAKSVLTDVVDLSNLTIGREYTVFGTLMDKETGEAITDAEGNAVSVELTFTAEEKNQTVELSFTVDASIRENRTTVVYEDLIHNGVVVSYHTDIDDEGQSIHHPKVTTTAFDAETDEHLGRARKETTIIDKVELTNLIVGQTYTITGVLMDQSTNRPYVDADGREVRPDPITFTATKPNETKEMIFVFDGSNLEGKTVTVFEDLSHNDYTVAVHHDITSEPQSVHYPKIGTTAMDKGTGTHKATKDGIVTVLDTVTYTNLKPGTYVMRGTLMVKTTGQPMTDQGCNPLVTERRFEVTEENISGQLVLPFVFNTSRLTGTDVVVFEKLYMVQKSEGDSEQPDEEKLVPVAEHEDMEDEGQTVSYMPKPHAPKTGDVNNIDMWLELMGLFLMICVGSIEAMLLSKKQKRSDGE